MTEILTTHAGSLPRSPELIAANAARPVGEDGLTPAPTDEFREVLRQAVVDVVAKQREIGISLPNDGEYGHLMGSAVNYGAWWSYIFDRVSGLELTGSDHFSSEPVRSAPGDVRLTTFPDRRGLPGPDLRHHRALRTHLPGRDRTDRLLRDGPRADRAAHHQRAGGPARGRLRARLPQLPLPGLGQPHQRRPLRRRGLLPRRL